MTKRTNRSCYCIPSCQCERDISKVTNFCFTWIAHETCDNERIQTSKIVVIAYFTSNFWICFCSITLWIRFENSRIISIIIFFDDHVWCTIESKNEIIRTRNTFSFELTWNSLEHELLVFRLDLISTFFVWSHRNDRISCIFVWSHRNDLKSHYRRDFRIWQIRIDRNKLFQQVVFITKFKNDNRWRCYAHRVCWNFDDSLKSDLLSNPFEIVTTLLLRCSSIDFHMNDLIESNYCKIDVFKNISKTRFVDVEKLDCFDICFIFRVKFCQFFNMK